MLNGRKLTRWLAEAGVSFVTGVPDSVLEGFCRALSAAQCNLRHEVAVNEGAAIATAIGWHLATRSIPVVYLQNSGLGNAVNPLASLASSDVFDVPLLILIGWRGKPGQLDEPQHRLMGAATKSILHCLKIPCVVLPRKEEEAHRAVRSAMGRIQSCGKSCAILIEPGTISAGDEPSGTPTPGKWSGTEALEELCRYIPVDDTCVSTVGLISRGLAQQRQKVSRALNNDLLVVGGMGLASHVALGIALGAKARRVWCLDGDGALLMHMGAAAAIGASSAKKLIHVLFNNGMHESVGGFSTAQPYADFKTVSLACGYKASASVSTASELSLLTSWIRNQRGPYFLQLRVAPNSSPKMPRPSTTPLGNKFLFVDTLSRAKIAGSDIVDLRPALRKGTRTSRAGGPESVRTRAAP